MFKKPIAITHAINIPKEDLKEVVDHAKDGVVSILKTAGLCLLIGVPSVILFGYAANVASEVAIDRLTN